MDGSDREIQLVRVAVAAVASGRFPRVTLAALARAEELLPTARALARERGVWAHRIVANGRCTGIVVERAPALSIVS